MDHRYCTCSRTWRRSILLGEMKRHCSMLHIIQQFRQHRHAIRKRFSVFPKSRSSITAQNCFAAYSIEENAFYVLLLCPLPTNAFRILIVHFISLLHSIYMFLLSNGSKLFFLLSVSHLNTSRPSNLSGYLASKYQNCMSVPIF